MKGLVKVIPARTQKKKEDSCKESVHLLKKYSNNHEQNVGRNMDGEGWSDEVSDRNEEHVI